VHCKLRLCREVNQSCGGTLRFPWPLVRAAFVIRSGIEDTAIFSGIYRSEPLIAAIDAMIADEDAYARFAVAHTPIPA
jgi:hypothetical protein